MQPVHLSLFLTLFLSLWLLAHTGPAALAAHSSPDQLSRSFTQPVSSPSSPCQLPAISCAARPPLTLLLLHGATSSWLSSAQAAPPPPPATGSPRARSVLPWTPTSAASSPATPAPTSRRPPGHPWTTARRWSFGRRRRWPSSVPPAASSGACSGHPLPGLSARPPGAVVAPANPVVARPPRRPSPLLRRPPLDAAPATAGGSSSTAGPRTRRRVLLVGRRRHV